jgi:hypothetical protein
MLFLSSGEVIRSVTHLAPAPPIRKAVPAMPSQQLTSFGRFGVLAPMARKLRIEYAGAICHVMNRGDRQEPIFPLDEYS